MASANASEVSGAEPRTPPLGKVDHCAQAPWWLAIIALLAIGTAIGHLWFGWCMFPISSWNEARLAPAFAFRNGLPVYSPLGGGPLSTWIYGPIGVIINLPATFAGSVTHAIETAGVINLLTVTLPFAVVCLTAAELRPHCWVPRALALAIAIVLLPASNLAFQVADHSAMALGLLSCWLLTRLHEPTTLQTATAASCAVLAIWSKQLEIALPLGQIAFLWLGRNRTTALRYCAWIVGLGAISVPLMMVNFGFDALWLNLVKIPSRLPMVDPLGKTREWLPWLLGYVFLPLAVIAWRARFGWRDPCEGATGRLLRCGEIVFTALLPIGFLAFFKIGGATNVLHSWYYLLAPASVAVVAWAWKGQTTRRGLAVLLIALCAMRMPELTALPRRPITQHLEAAEHLARAEPGAIWFPQHPIITFYTDRTLYHDEDGIATRSLAGFGLGNLNRSSLPPRLSTIAYIASQTSPFANILFPDFRQRTITGHWVLYRREPPRPP